jgi:hypothetical protein
MPIKKAVGNVPAATRKKQGGQKFVKIDARFTTLILRD